MDVLKKPHKALRKFVHRVSIQTLAKNSDGEEVEPYGITRGSSRAWAEPTQVDLHDPKVCAPVVYAINLFGIFVLLDTDRMLTRVELAGLEERLCLRFPPRHNCRRRYPEDTLHHDKQHHSGRA